MAGILYPDEHPKVNRHSSIDQFNGYLSTYDQGGPIPIVFDQIDGITCETVKSQPVIISYGDDVGYTFPEAHCHYASETFVYFDEEGVEQKPLPSCFGEGGLFYEYYTNKNTFINDDNDSSIGTYNRYELRTGLDYVICDESLPPAE